jgi:hypothetical protein
MRSETLAEVGAERAPAGELDIGVKQMDHGLRDDENNMTLQKL